MLVDEFRIELNLHHPFCDPDEITQELSLEPWFAVKDGTRIGEVHHKKTAWLCHFRGGSTNSDAQALGDIVSWCSERRAFISRFIEEGGEVEFVLDSATDSSFSPGDKLFELSLHPEFLNCLAANNIHLRLQVWMAESHNN